MFWFRRSPPKAPPPELPTFVPTWVLPKRLAVGPLPQENDVALLQKQGVQAVLSLCQEMEPAIPLALKTQFTWQGCWLPDSHYTEPMTAEHLVQAVAIVREQITAGRPTYVHCLAGQERSPTVCLAYLCRYERLNLFEALAWLKQIHRRTRPTDNQIQAIQAFLALEQH